MSGQRRKDGIRGPRDGRVDGRLVVLAVFGGALLLWGIVFFTGLKERERSRAGRDGAGAAGPFRDSTAHPDSLRTWLGRFPAAWIRVTPVEGQGLVIFIPCYSQNGSLAFRFPVDSLPQVDCEYCDSLGRYAVLAAARTGRDSVYDLHLNPPAGSLKVVPVTDSLLQRYPESPLRDRVLLWTRPRQDAAGGAARDTLIFVPKAQESEFEALRAEDENPEGCGSEAE